MRPNQKMAATAAQALEWHGDKPELREFCDPWMVRFARTIGNPKQWATIKRAADWFAEHSSFRGRPGFFTVGSPTAERVAWDLLGGDAGERWAADAVAAGPSEEASIMDTLDRLEAEADAREAEFSARRSVDWTQMMAVEDWASPDLFETLGRRKPEWGGIAVIEGILTDDMRLIEPGALTHRPLPLPLRAQPADIGGHDGAIPIGAHTAFRRSTVEEIEALTGTRLPDESVPIWTHGVFDTGEDAVKSRQQMSDGMRTGVSVDLVDVSVRLPSDPEELERVMIGEAPLRIRAGKVAGSTTVDIPAFQDARLQILGDAVSPDMDRDALVASGGKLDGVTLRVVAPVDWFAASPVPEPVEWYPVSVLAEGAYPADDGLVDIPADDVAEGPSGGVEETVVDLGEGVSYSTGPLVASGGATRPPSAWFEAQPFTELTPFTIHPPDESGLRRFTGHVGKFGSCHIGFADRCVDVPRGLDYDSFQSERSAGVVRCVDGAEVAAGPFIMDTVHPNLRKQASDAAAFYGHTGSLWGQGRLYEDEIGLQACGWVLPSVTDEQLAVLDAVDLSPDWRPRATAAGGFGVVAVLAVPVSGFNLGLAASGPPPDEEPIDAGRTVAVRKADLLEALGRPVPASLVAEVEGRDPAVEARKLAVIGRLTGACDCGGSCCG